MKIHIQAEYQKSLLSILSVVLLSGVTIAQTALAPYCPTAEPRLWGFMDEKGVTQVIKAGREFEHLQTNSLDDRFWASVAVAGDAYLFKGDKKLYCIKN